MSREERVCRERRGGSRVGFRVSFACISGVFACRREREERGERREKSELGESVQNVGEREDV